MYYPYSEPHRSLGLLDQAAFQHMDWSNNTNAISATQKIEFSVEDEGVDFFIVDPNGTTKQYGKLFLLILLPLMLLILC